MFKKIVATIVFVWLIALSAGCSSFKKKTRTAAYKVDKITETGTRTIITKGDSVVFVPKIVYVDDTITKIHKNVVLTTIYKQGKVSKINCKEKEQKIIEDYLKQQKTETTIKTNEKEKQGFKDIWFLYIGIILILIIFLLLIFLIVIKKYKL